MHTKDILAAALREAGLEEMAKKAATGWYHDYLSPLDLPETQLANDLKEAGTPAAMALLERHMNGDFDASKAESDEWARSREGQDAFARLTQSSQPSRQQRRAAERMARKDYNRPTSTERLGDAPIQAEYHAKMNAIAAALDDTLNGGVKGAARETGFVLLVFPFGDAESGRCNFISNGADRKDVVTLMKEMIARFDGQAEVSGRA
jgi:hypothetical protein